MDPNEVAVKVGQDLDKTYLRFSELLVGLAGGTVGIIIAFLIGSKLLESSCLAWVLFVGLLLLAVSIVLCVGCYLYYLQSLENNPIYQLALGISIENIDQTRHKKDKRIHQAFLHFQLLFFILGEMCLVIYTIPRIFC